MEYLKDYTCSYRWQGCVRAAEIADVYRRYEGIAYQTGEAPKKEHERTTLPLERHTYPLMRPSLGDWDVGGPYREVKRWGRKHIKAGANFHGGLDPYANEVHHLIPKGTILRKIRSTANGDEAMVTAIVEGLLRVKYNVNSPINMLILPIDKEIAQLLRLPRHRRDKNTPHHAVYSKMVDRRLNQIFLSYRELCVKRKEKEHPKETKPELDKIRLERLSGRLYKKLHDSQGVADGKEPAGDSLDAIAAAG